METQKLSRMMERSDLMNLGAERCGAGGLDCPLPFPFPSLVSKLLHELPRLRDGAHPNPNHNPILMSPFPAWHHTELIPLLMLCPLPTPLPTSIMPWVPPSPPPDWMLTSRTQRRSPAASAGPCRTQHSRSSAAPTGCLRGPWPEGERRERLSPASPWHLPAGPLCSHWGLPEHVGGGNGVAKAPSWGPVPISMSTGDVGRIAIGQGPYATRVETHPLNRAHTTRAHPWDSRIPNSGNPPPPSSSDIPHCTPLSATAATPPHPHPRTPVQPCPATFPPPPAVPIPTRRPLPGLWAAVRRWRRWRAGGTGIWCAPGGSPGFGSSPCPSFPSQHR